MVDSSVLNHTSLKNFKKVKTMRKLNFLLELKKEQSPSHLIVNVSFAHLCESVISSRIQEHVLVFSSVAENINHFSRGTEGRPRWRMRLNESICFVMCNQSSFFWPSFSLIQETFTNPAWLQMELKRLISGDGWFITTCR